MHEVYLLWKHLHVTGYLRVWLLRAFNGRHNLGLGSKLWKKSKQPFSFSKEGKSRPKNSLLTVFVRKIVLLPGMNLLIIFFRLLTSSDPGTQSSSLSSLLSFELSLSALVVSVLGFVTGVLRAREGRPAGTAGTGRPKREKTQI